MHPLVLKQPVGVGEVGIAEDRPHIRRLPAGQEQLRRDGVGLEPHLVVVDHVVEGLVDDEALLGQIDRGV